jgi:hypothetical protein
MDENQEKNIIIIKKLDPTPPESRCKVFDLVIILE